MSIMVMYIDRSLCYLIINHNSVRNALKGSNEFLPVQQYLLGSRVWQAICKTNG